MDIETDRAINNKFELKRKMGQGVCKTYLVYGVGDFGDISE